jgi:hypothetical protein
MAWNDNKTIELTGKVDGVEVEFRFYPNTNTFEATIPAQEDQTYIIELYARDRAGNQTYITDIKIVNGVLNNYEALMNALLRTGLLKHRL